MKACIPAPGGELVSSPKARTVPPLSIGWYVLVHASYFYKDLHHSSTDKIREERRNRRDTRSR
jgi:hypothetical protein